MTLIKRGQHLYEFGPFRLDPDERVLWRDDKIIPLPPKATETLLVLVQKSGYIVSRQDFLRQVWPDTFVGENNLSVNISLLRKILGDEQDGSKYIETVPKRGYRFVAGVKERWYEGAEPHAEHEASSHVPGSGEMEEGPGKVNSEGLPERDSLSGVTSLPVATPSVPLAALRRNPPKPVLWIFILPAVLLIAGAALWLIARRPTPTTQATAQSIIPVTTFPGGEIQPAISPDGKQVAFAWRGNNGDNWDIYVKLIGAGDPLRLTYEPVMERNPVWSPDGRYIAYLRESPDGVGVSIYLVPSLGGEARKLAETYGLGFSWSPDGQYLAVAERGSREEPFSIFLLSIKTGEKRAMTFPPAQCFGDINPAFSPDGKYLAFAGAHASSINAWDIYLVPVGGGELKRLTFDDTLIDGLGWTADGREIVFSSIRSGGVPSLWRIAASGGQPEPLSAVGINADSPSLSRQGNRLAYAHSMADSNVWRVEVADSRRASGEPAVLISSTLYDHSPEYSPDGKRIAFVSGRTGTSQLWICNSDGSAPVQLTSFAGAATGCPRWSPDGQNIAFDSNPEGNADIFVIGVEGGSPRRLSWERSEDIAPSWSRDGRWIYFTSNRGGQFQIWKMSVEGGNPTQVTRQGGYVSVESPDGKYLYYTKGHTTPGIWRVPVEGGEETMVLDTLKAGFLRYWAVVDQGIYFATRATSPRPTILFFSFASGQLTEVLTLEKPLLVGAPGLSVSPEGRWLIFAQIDRSESDIMLVDGFR